MTTVRDPVHGDIHLTPLELRLLDLPQMQRLRGVKQLGTAYLVYPGALHTRFDHSLGTLAMCNRILQALKPAAQIDAAEEAAVRAACLLHDISHAPFGHTMEDERQLFPRHDTPQRLLRFLHGDDLRRVLGDYHERVVAILLRQHTPFWCQEMVSGTIDADLLDYVHRDAYFAGLTQRYDERIFSSFALHQGHLVINLCRNGLERSDTRSELLHLLRLRFFLTERVYLHHTKVAAGAMIAKAVEVAEPCGAITREQLDGYTDGMLLGDLASGRYGSLAAGLAANVQNRKLVRRAYVLSRSDLKESKVLELIRLYTAAPAERRRAEEEMRVRAKAHGPVILHVPPMPSLRELHMPVLSTDGLSRLLERPGVAVEAKAMATGYENLWQLVVFSHPEERVAVSQAAADWFGLKSPYDVTAKSSQWHD